MAADSGGNAERLAQPRARPEKTRQHGALLHAHHVCDFLRRKSHQHLQHQRLAIILVEAEDRVSHFGDALVLGRRQQVGFGGDERVDIGDLEALLLEGPRELAAHDREQPGLGLALVRQRIERLPRAQHRLLDHVFGESAVPSQPPCESQAGRAEGFRTSSRNADAGPYLRRRGSCIKTGHSPGYFRP